MNNEEKMQAKLPSFQFYIGDWQKDPNLRRATKAEKGVLIDMLCLMYECEDRGILSSGGTPWSDSDVAGAIGGDISENLTCLSELLRKGVVSRNQTGAIFSRRMVRDEHKRKLCVEAGKLGGNPTLKGDPKGHSKGSSKGVSNRNTTPSSSSSISIHLQAQFEKFWEVYPKKKGKGRAERVFFEINPSEDLFNRMINAIKLQKISKDWIKESGRFIPHPGKWLADKGWEDDHTDVIEISRQAFKPTGVFAEAQP